MKNLKRLKAILENLYECDCLADVGCDHGHITAMALSSGKAKRAVISDISAKSLKKAEDLLRGRCVTAVTADGLTIEHEPCDQVLIAGMGGGEIIKILKNAPFSPKRLVLQPMKDAPAVREYLLKSGYKIDKDFTFFIGSKFYNLIRAERGSDSYTEIELLLGRDNLKDMTREFKEFLRARLKELIRYEEKSVLGKDGLKKKIDMYSELLK